MSEAGRKCKRWSQESMEEAVKVLLKKGMPYRKASRKYNVPVESLRLRVIGAVEINARPGPYTVLMSEEEDSLAKYVIDMADMGFGL